MPPIFQCPEKRGPLCQCLYVKHHHFNLGPRRLRAAVISTLRRPSLGTASLIGWAAYKDELAIIEIRTQVDHLKEVIAACTCSKKSRCI